MNKTVRFSELVRVDGAPEETVGATTKLWGMNTMAPVWWAIIIVNHWRSNSGPDAAINASMS